MRAPSTEREHVAASSSPDQDLPNPGRPTKAVVDLEALGHNYSEVKRRAGDRSILAVVKAQAYGHGAVAVSRRLVELGTRMLGVALVEEGVELREAGITAPILVMGPVFCEQAREVVRFGLTPVVFTMQFARVLADAAADAGKELRVHVKVDTGMGRIGVAPEEARQFVRDVRGLPGIIVEGLMTHFADADLREKHFAAAQMEKFEALLRSLDADGIAIPLRHAANSAAVLEYGRALFTMVRPGIMLYGYNPLESGAGVDLRPALSLTTKIAFLKKVPAGVPISYGRTFTTTRESVIATVPIGYADGFSRSLSNKGEALVRGRRVRIAGRICMDMTMLDVTDVPGAAEGDDVVLIGRSGAERITAADIADKTGTIAYEVLCGISRRVPRVIGPN